MNAVRETSVESEQPLPDRTDVLVVGAGIGGLCAAARLAHAGLSVLVVDPLPTPGGKANEAVVDGVGFDTGPSVVTLTEQFEAVFAACGARSSDYLSFFEPTPAFRYRYSDGITLDVHAGWPATRASIASTLGADAALQADRFVAYAARIWSAAAPHFVMGPAPCVGTMVRLGLRHPGAVWSIDPFSTMQGAIARYVKEPHLRDLFARYATYNGSDVRTAPATLNCIAHVELSLGGWGVRGGLYRLVEALVELGRAGGARYVQGVRVNRLGTEGGRVTSVELSDGRTVAVGAVVCNADTAHMARLLGKRVPRVTPSTSGWNAVLRARRRADRVAHEVLFPKDYRQEFVDLFDRKRPPVEPTVYVCAQEKAHDRAGWAEHEPLFVMANAPAEPESGATDESTWQRLRTVVLDRLLQAGMIDEDDEVVWERSATELAAAFPDTRGSIYGPASNDPFAAFRRMANRHPSVGGLYVAGGSAHPGGGLPLCARSGLSAANLLVDDLQGRAGRSMRLLEGT